MKIFFNFVGTLLFLAALYFGYLAVDMIAMAHDRFGQPSDVDAFASIASTAGATGGVALQFLIAAGIFLGVAEIVSAIERAARRPSPAAPDETLSDGSF